MTDMADVSVDLGALAREQEKPVLKFAWSAQINEFAAALAKAQGQMSNASKDSANPYFKSKYADLASVVDVIRKPLSDNGIAYVQPFTTSAKQVTVSTVLMHSSGQWMSTEATFPVLPMPRKKEEGQPYVPPNPNDPVTPQAFGSAESYLRRYALSSMLGIAAEDDDGNAASGQYVDKRAQANGTDAVKGALSRQTTASAKKAEPPKEAAKPEAIPAPQTPEAMEVALRFSKLWETAKAAGYKASKFDDFRFGVLDARIPSSALNADQMSQLEAAWPAWAAEIKGP